MRTDPAPAWYGSPDSCCLKVCPLRTSDAALLLRLHLRNLRLASATFLLFRLTSGVFDLALNLVRRAFVAFPRRFRALVLMIFGHVFPPCEIQSRRGRLGS